MNSRRLVPTLADPLPAPGWQPGWMLGRGRLAKRSKFLLYVRHDRPSPRFHGQWPGAGSRKARDIEAFSAKGGAQRGQEETFAPHDGHLNAGLQVRDHLQLGAVPPGSRAGDSKSPVGRSERHRELAAMCWRPSRQRPYEARGRLAYGDRPRRSDGCKSLQKKALRRGAWRPLPGNHGPESF